MEPDMASIAALIGEPTRAIILSALLGGEALPASELARRASITPQTASSHLSKLLEGKLVTVTVFGRHRYYELKNHTVAQTIEALQTIAPLPEERKGLHRHIGSDLCKARTCYDHLAGKLGVAFGDALVDQRYLVAEESNYSLTEKGQMLLQNWEIDEAFLRKQRRKFAYACLDWSERRFHVAGSLGAAFANVFMERGWVKKLPDSRALDVTTSGFEALEQYFGIKPF